MSRQGQASLAGPPPPHTHTSKAGVQGSTVLTDVPYSPPPPCRAGEQASTGLTEVLVGLGFEAGRLKTGTPARVDARTVNFSKLEKQPGGAG